MPGSNVRAKSRSTATRYASGWERIASSANRFASSFFAPPKTGRGSIRSGWLRCHR